MTSFNKCYINIPQRSTLNALRSSRGKKQRLLDPVNAFLPSVVADSFVPVFAKYKDCFSSASIFYFGALGCAFDGCIMPLSRVTSTVAPVAKMQKGEVAKG